MPHVIFVASDVFGEKRNLELEFPSCPSIPELTKYTEMAFTAEINARRPGSAPFQVAKFHVVDSVTDDWVDVISPSQLRNYCQVYAFQPHSTRYTESQGHIPPAVKPRMPPPMSSGGMVGAGSIPSARSGHYPRAPPAKSLPESASHDEKARIVFEEADTNSNRVLEAEELKNLYRACCLDFTVSTVDDLFRKADIDRDGVLSFQEWQRFCELYPTLLDCLYYRLKNYWEEMAGRGELDAARGMRPMLEDSERAAKAAFDQTQIDADDIARRLAEADRMAAEAAARQRAAEDAARDANRDIDRARQCVADRERDLAAEKERARQTQMAIQQSAREVDAAQRRLAAAQAAVADAETAERMAAQALADAQREVARQRANADQAARDAAAACDRHNQLMAEAPRNLDDAANRLAMAERDLAAAVQRQRDLAASASDAAALAAEAARKHDELARMLQALRDRQEPARQAWLEAQRAIAEHDGKIAEMEAMLQREADSKRALYDQEQSLVEQELRLREQRENLENKEGALREAHTQFFRAAGRSPQRSSSPYASPFNKGSYY